MKKYIFKSITPNSTTEIINILIFFRAYVYIF